MLEQTQLLNTANSLAPAGTAAGSLQATGSLSSTQKGQETMQWSTSKAQPPGVLATWPQPPAAAAGKAAAATVDGSADGRIRAQAATLPYYRPNLLKALVAAEEAAVNATQPRPVAAQPQPQPPGAVAEAARGSQPQPPMGAPVAPTQTMQLLPGQPQHTTVAKASAALPSTTLAASSAHTPAAIASTTAPAVLQQGSVPTLPVPAAAGAAGAAVSAAVPPSASLQVLATGPASVQPGPITSQQPQVRAPMEAYCVQQ